VNALSLFGVLMAIARLGSPTSVGQFVLGLSIAAPVMGISMLQLRNLIVTDARGDFSFADYFATRICWTAVELGVIVDAATAFRLDRQTLLIVLLVGLAKCAESLSDMTHGLFQRLERMDYSGMSMMARGVIACFATAAVMWVTRSLAWSVVALAASWSFTFLTYDLPRTRHLLAKSASPKLGWSWRPRFHASRMFQISVLGLPLGIVMGIISLQTNIPRYVLQAVEGERSVGYFGAMAYPMLAAALVSNALGQSASPRLARHFMEDAAAFGRLVKKLCLVTGALGVGLVVATALLGRVFLRLYGEEYSAHQGAFVVLSVGTAIQLVGSCWGYALTAARALRIQVLLVSTSSLTSLALAIWLIPRWGISGAAMTSVVTSLLMLLLFWIATIRTMQHQRREDRGVALGVGGVTGKTNQMSAVSAAPLEPH
jgi:O-antigen/teichoic acid export membrane protein